MTPRRPRWRQRLLTAAILLLGLHGALWGIALWRLDAELDASRRNLTEQGWLVTTGPAHWGGWPLAARIELDELSIAAADSSLGWRSPNVGFALELLRPFWVTASLGGPHVLRIGGVAVPIRTAQLTVAARLLGTPLRTELSLRGLHAEGPGGQLAVGTLDLRIAQDPRAGAGQPALTLAGSATELDLPSPILTHASGFGTRIAALGLDASLTGPLPPGPPSRLAAAAWQASAGKLAITRLALRWGKLDVTGDAELTLDAQLQPTGTGTLRAIGVPETADALAAAGAIPNGTARAVKALTALMARPPDGEVELPLSITDRTLALARFPITRLPELHW